MNILDFSKFLLAVSLIFSAVGCENEEEKKFSQFESPMAATQQETDRITQSLLTAKIDPQLKADITDLVHYLAILVGKPPNLVIEDDLKKLASKFRSLSGQLGEEGASLKGYADMVDQFSNELKVGRPVGPRLGIINMQVLKFLSVYTETRNK